MGSVRNDPVMPDRRTLIIASAPRTGSTLLSRLLKSTGVAGLPSEFLHPSAILEDGPRLGIRRTRRVASLPRLERHRLGLERQPGRLTDVSPSKVRRYLEVVENANRSANGVFAINLHWSQFEIASSRWGIVFPPVGPDAVWVHLWREDRFAQAVSWLRALQTDRWNTDDKGSSGEPVYDSVRLGRLARRAIVSKKGWDRHFETFATPPMMLTYEQLSSDPAGAVDEILGLLGEKSAVEPEASMGVQRDDLSREWIERMLVDLPGLAGQRYATPETR